MGCAFGQRVGSPMTKLVLLSLVDRAIRLPADWQPSQADINFAQRRASTMDKFGEPLSDSKTTGELNPAYEHASKTGRQFGEAGSDETPIPFGPDWLQRPALAATASESALPLDQLDNDARSLSPHQLQDVRLMCRHGHGASCAPERAKPHIRGNPSTAAKSIKKGSYIHNSYVEFAGFTVRIMWRVGHA